MDHSTATLRLASLAQETRLAIFRTLVQAGPEGLNPGTLAERLDIAQATLSFHLKELRHADMILSRQQGRFIFYSANFEAMNGLLSFLTDNCCAETGAQCLPPPCCDEAST
ncbi:MAG: metalloregulator ArsR/SmtB family transcription factor [Pseudomonadota bacterium]|nr:metalloregulator ArsR/SmtB family transcription factor [Pseudomonadota bacterium]